MRAKRRLEKRSFVEVYNLLGDPALPISRPQMEVSLTRSPTAEQGLALSATVPTDRFSGRALVDWLDRDDQIVRSAEMAVVDRRFEIVFDGPPSEIAQIHSARIYVWNASARIDGMGALELNATPGVPALGQHSPGADQRTGGLRPPVLPRI